MLRHLFAVAAVLLLPAAQAQNLILGTKLELNTLDPHFFAAFPTGSSHEYLYDKLAVLDEKLRVTPSPRRGRRPSGAR